MLILIYYQNNKRTIFLESLCKELMRKGHHVLFLTMAEEDILHDKLQEYGIDTYSMPSSVKGKFSQTKYLYSFCKKNKVEVILPHLQMANFQALLVGRFLGIQVFPCRHHIDGSFLIKSRNAQRLDKLVNFLSNKQIVVSEHAKRFMVEVEKANPKKITYIPLGYDFSLYKPADNSEVETIRQKLPNQLQIIMISRLIAPKRHIVAFRAVNKLIKEGLDIGIFVMDSGQELDNLKKFVVENNLQKHILFMGYQNHIMNYVDASDLLLLPSILESSNQVTKEVAIRGKTAIVTQGIGDFDEYIKHKQNAFLINQENAEEDIYQILKCIYYNKKCLPKMGEKLKQEVLKRFDIKYVAEQYCQLFEEK